MEKLDNISWKDEMYLSDTASEVYSDFLENESELGNSNFMFEDIDDLYEQIITQNINLTDFQKNKLLLIFKHFDAIRKEIDPDRLKSFEYFHNEIDSEFLLFRKTSQYLINLIIHSNDDLVFSVISKTDSENDILKFLKQDEEIESIIYSFFAY